MPIDRRNRVTFEEMAEIYNEVRPIYPDQLVEDALRLSGIPPDGRILEIGCGPGNATAAFARHGYRILGIELGARLATLARQNCRAYPQVEIRNTAFEDWDIEEAAFDLAVSADAFHWIPPEVGYPKVARALKDSGSIAFFWWVPVDPETDWSQAIDAVYQEIAPGLVNPDKTVTSAWLVDVIQENLRASGCFDAADVKQYQSTLTVSSEQYIKSLWTHSSHRGVEESIRHRLYDGIRTMIERFGGQVNIPLLTVLFLAKVIR